MNEDQESRLGDRIVRRRRETELAPMTIRGIRERRPSIFSYAPAMLMLSLVALVLAGGILLMLPFATSSGDAAPPLVA